MFNMKFFYFINFAREKGLLLLIATFMALYLTNFPNPLGEISLPYSKEISFLPWHFILDDCLMVIFFLLIGMEIKKELISGDLASPEARIVPIIAASAGVLVPIIFYLIFSEKSEGAFITTATDIAFTLAILNAFKKKIPSDIRVFITALAIIDDLIAVAAIAIFYSKNLSLLYIIMILPLLGIFHFLYKKKFNFSLPYFLLGAILWWFLNNAGIHTTIAGVILGLYLPSNQKLEKIFSNLVGYFILPFFAFYHSQISLEGITWDFFTKDITKAVTIGLFVGKQLGISLAFFILIKKRVIKTKVSFYDFYLASILCGIGFTMSIFIANLAMTGEDLLAAKLGVLLGSFLSAFLGILLLSFKKNLPLN
jgi:NhaA family Na+:H+ antiporter